MSPRDLSPSLDVLFERSEEAIEGLYELPLQFTPSEIHRDAALHRFRTAFEILWRASLRYLLEEEGLEMGSPKGVVRAAAQVGLLPGEDADAALLMADDRNLTGHAYEEANANAIFARIGEHGELMRRWLERMRAGRQS